MKSVVFENTNAIPNKSIKLFIDDAVNMRNIFGAYYLKDGYTIILCNTFSIHMCIENIDKVQHYLDKFLFNVENTIEFNFENEFLSLQNNLQQFFNSEVEHISFNVVKNSVCPECKNNTLMSVFGKFKCTECNYTNYLSDVNSNNEVVFLGDKIPAIWINTENNTFGLNIHKSANDNIPGCLVSEDLYNLKCEDRFVFNNINSLNVIITQLSLLRDAYIKTYQQ